MARQSKSTQNTRRRYSSEFKTEALALPAMLGVS